MRVFYGADHVATHVATKRFGNGDRTVCVLVILKNSGNRAAYCYARAIQGVHQTRLVLGRFAETDVGATCLVVLEVRARGDLYVTVVRGHPNLDVVRHGAGEAKVAGGKTDHAVRQAKTLQHALGVVGQLFKLGVRGFGGGELYKQIGRASCRERVFIVV